MRIFFGGPLTNLTHPEETKAFYTSMGEVATANGFSYYWAWQRGTDPELNPDVPASRVYQIDEYELEKSDIMIAYMGEPSTGTGQEIEYARQKNIPVYLLYQTKTHVSRMTTGSPNVKGEIIFDSFEEGLQKLDQLLKSLVAYGTSGTKE